MSAVETSQKKVRKLQDKVTINKWRTLNKISLSEAIQRATRSIRTAKRYGLNSVRSRYFVKRWFNYEPTQSTNALYKDGPYTGCKKYARAHKLQICAAFKAENNDQSKKTSLREYCLKTDEPGCNASNVSRWLRDASLGAVVRPHDYRRVPRILNTDQETMRMQFCEANTHRDWRYCSFSDEFYFDKNEMSKILRGRQKYYCTDAEKVNIPEVLSTKWAGLKCGAFILIDPHDAYITLKTFENDEYVENEEAKVDESTPGYILLDKLDCQQLRAYEEQDVAYRHLRNDNEWLKRNWVRRLTKPRRKKKDKKDVKIPASFTMTSKNCIELCAKEVEEWLAYKREITPPEEHVFITHFHDNSAGWSSEKVKQYWKDNDIPVYPGGGVYGYHYGFPPYSPDFNCVAEYAAGAIKYAVAIRLAKMTESARLKVSVKDLANLLREEFEKIPLEKYKSWLCALEKHIEESLWAEGRYGKSVKGLRLKKDMIRLAD